MLLEGLTKPIRVSDLISGIMDASRQFALNGRQGWLQLDSLFLREGPKSESFNGKLSICRCSLQGGRIPEEPQSAAGSLSVLNSGFPSNRLHDVKRMKRETEIA